MVCLLDQTIKQFSKSLYNDSIHFHYSAVISYHGIQTPWRCATMLENSQVDLKIRCTVVLTRVKIVSDYRWSLRNWQVDLIYDCLQNLEIIILLAFYIFFFNLGTQKVFCVLKSYVLQFWGQIHIQRSALSSLGQENVLLTV